MTEYQNDRYRTGCRRWEMYASLHLFLFGVAAVVVLLIMGNVCVEAVDTTTTTNTTTTSSRNNEADHNMIRPDIKQQRLWTLLHRILPSTTNTDISTMIQTSSLEWRKRGTINLTIIEAKLISEDPVLLEILNDDDALSESFMDDIRTLDRMTNTTTWYQLKIIPQDDDDDKSSTQLQLLTSVPSCAVLRSNFRDEILVQFQSMRSSNIISITYIPYISRFAPKKCMDYIPIVTTTTTTSSASSTTKGGESTSTTSNETKYQFITKLSWETAVPGMVVGQPQMLDPITLLPVNTNMKIKPPPGLHWFPQATRRNSNVATSKSKSGGPIPPGDDDDSSDESTTKPDNSPFGFFRRYYYIFIPLLLMNIMNSMNPPPPPEQQPAQSTGTSGRPVASSVAAAATAGGEGQVRQRRGKKD